MKYRTLALTATGIAVGALALAQPSSFQSRVEAAIEQAFVGLTNDGEVQPGLFSIEATGASTAAVREAAARFLDSLSAEQRERTRFSVDDSEWRNWANVHQFQRQGVSLLELNEDQRALAYGLIEAGMSERGYQTSRDIMRLNHTVAEMVDNFDDYGEHLYNFTVMGEPSATDPWGWQLDGHHLIINYFVLGDQVVMTPVFMGSEPVAATSGLYEGTVIMQAEQDDALAFMQSLSDDQRSRAIINDVKQRGENQAEMASDNVQIAYEGLPVSELSGGQTEELVDLISLYVGQMDTEHADIKLEEVIAHLDRTWFAWKGPVADDAVFYYRIHSPVIYIEFDHQGPVALGTFGDPATRDHIHSVVRTPNGNDYGKDLLRQHMEMYANDPSHGHADTAVLAANKSL